MKTKKGFVENDPNSWKKVDREGFAEVTKILAKPGAFIRAVGRDGYEVIRPGEWTKFESKAFRALFFNYLLGEGTIEPAADKKRWIPRGKKK